jgi:hypothetical protein
MYLNERILQRYQRYDFKKVILNYYFYNYKY